MKHGEPFYQLSQEGFGALPLIICEVVVFLGTVSTQEWTKPPRSGDHLS